jgi:tRNA A37 threonylcarbamoyladenosine dehydratase
VTTPANAAQADVAPADLERRFGALRRLYGEEGYARLRALRVAVVGLGGVGSWTAEALARSGVAGLVLVDFDHVAESNINRQVQALGRTVGQGKGEALRERIADIHPACEVDVVDAFAGADNWPGLLPHAVDAVIDACDQVRAKVALSAWALRTRAPSFVTVGAAGGKRAPQRAEVGDLAAASHDPLLAEVRRRLRRDHGAMRTGAIGIACVFSREAVTLPPGEAGCDVEANLACHGYGSSVMVTAAFGLAAAAQAVELCVGARGAGAPQI